MVCSNNLNRPFWFNLSLLQISSNFVEYSFPIIDFIFISFGPFRLSFNFIASMISINKISSCKFFRFKLNSFNSVSDRFFRYFSKIFSMHFGATLIYWSFVSILESLCVTCLTAWNKYLISPCFIVVSTLIFSLIPKLSKKLVAILMICSPENCVFNSGICPKSFINPLKFACFSISFPSSFNSSYIGGFLLTSGNASYSLLLKSLVINSIIPICYPFLHSCLLLNFIIKI